MADVEVVKADESGPRNGQRTTTDNAGGGCGGESRRAGARTRPGRPPGAASGAPAGPLTARGHAAPWRAGGRAEFLKLGSVPADRAIRRGRGPGKHMPPAPFRCPGPHSARSAALVRFRSDARARRPAHGTVRVVAPWARLARP